MTHQFDAGIAEIYGVEIAIMVQNFAFWIAKNKANNRNFYEGKTWTYNTIKAFNELFPYWSESQIRRILKKMEAEGILLTGNFNEVKYDRTIWYTFTNAFYEKHKCILQNRQMEVTKPSNGSDETVTPIPDKLPDKLPVILPDSLSSLKNKPNYQSFLDLYNKVCPSLPKAIKVNDKRKGLINAVFEEYGEEAVKEVLSKVEEYPFLTGENDRGWKADFEWLMNRNNLLKVMEGRYDRKPKKLKGGDDGYYDNPPTTQFTEVGENRQSENPKSVNQPLLSTDSSLSTDKTKYISRFNVFWEAYPRKEGKKNAEKVFSKLKPNEELLKVMLSALEVHKQQKGWQDKQFIPHPATWLNQERWNDEVEVEEVHRISMEGYA